MIVLKNSLELFFKMPWPLVSMYHNLTITLSLNALSYCWLLCCRRNFSGIVLCLLICCLDLYMLYRKTLKTLRCLFFVISSDFLTFDCIFFFPPAKNSYISWLLCCLLYLFAMRDCLLGHSPQ